MQVGISRLGGYEMLAGDCLGVFSKVVMGQNNEWLTAGAASAVAAPSSSVAGPLDPHGLGGPGLRWLAATMLGILVTKPFRPIFVADTQTILSRRRLR
jgi:hypothetical protein